MVFCSSNEIRICIDFIYSGETPAIKVNGLSGDGLDEVNYDGKISVEDFAKTFAYRDYSLCSYIVTVDIGKKKKMILLMLMVLCYASMVKMRR